MRAGRPERACGADLRQCALSRSAREDSAISGASAWQSAAGILSLCMIELERHARHAPLLVRLGGKKGSKGVGWAHGAVASAKGLQISAILTPVLCAVPNMNQGGAPKGKRASTLHRDREKREDADPLLKDKRLAERAEKRRFIERLKGPSTTSSEHMSTNTDVPQSTHAPLVDTLDAPSHAPVDVQSLPSLPNIKDRQEDTMYPYRYSGRDIIVRWQQKGKYISCSCDLSSPSACRGGLRLDRCPSIPSSWSLGAPAQHRPKDQHKYAANLSKSPQSLHLLFSVVLADGGLTSTSRLSSPRGGISSRKRKEIRKHSRPVFPLTTQGVRPQNTYLCGAMMLA